ncbi:uncharacterized protein METZ01_LOCUS220542 [marine metagenome]|uniref:Uncharacterized protein n=1 Tax=marine metagenome TaxID=408172 RepID=A0A382FXB7_9ZZZZ
MMMNDNLMKASEAAINYKHPDNPAC